MANQKTNLTQTVIAFKKISGVANTSMLKTDLAETIGSVVQNSSDRIFGDTIPTTGIPSAIYDVDVNQIVQKIEFDLVAVAGSKYAATAADSEAESSTSTTHSFALKLKDTYETDGGGNNPKAGTDPFVNGYYTSGSNGTLQLVPPLYNISYSIELQDQDGDPITTGDDMDWYFDYYSGILFRQDGDESTIPVSGSCYIYIGKFVSDVKSFPFTGSAIISGSLEITGSFDFLPNNNLRIKDSASVIQIEQSTNPELHLNVSTSVTPSLGDEVGKILFTNNSAISGSTHASIVTKAITGDWGVSGSATQIILSAYPSFSGAGAEDPSQNPYPLLILQTGSKLPDGAIDNGNFLYSYINTPLSGSYAKFDRLVANDLTFEEDLTVNGTLNAVSFQVASDDASISSGGNIAGVDFSGVSANFNTLEVGDGTQPGFKWYLTNGTIDGFNTADQEGVKLVTISGSTIRAHTGLIVDASASYVGLIANQDQNQDKPLLIARQPTGGDREVVITGSAFKIIGSDGIQTFTSDGTSGELTIGNSTEQISIIGSDINLTGSTNFANNVNVGTLIASTKVSASAIESTGVIDAEGRLSGSKLLLPKDDESYVRGIFFDSDSAIDGRITDTGTDLIIGYDDGDIITLNGTRIIIDSATDINSSLTASSLLSEGDTTINGTLFANGAFSPSSININGGDFIVDSNGALTTARTAKFNGGISASYFRTTPGASTIDPAKLLDNQLVADGSQSMGVRFRGDLGSRLELYGGKTNAYESESIIINNNEEHGERTIEFISGSNFLIQDSIGANVFVYDSNVAEFYLGKSGGSGTTTYFDSVTNNLRGVNTTISSSNFNIKPSILDDDPIDNTTKVLVHDEVTGRVYITGSFGSVDAPTASYVPTALKNISTGTGNDVVATTFDGTTFTRTINNVNDATSASYALDATSASYALDATSASYAVNTPTPTLQQVTDEGAITTTSITASIVSASTITATSFRGTATTASYVETAQTASYVENAQTASYVEQAISASFATIANSIVTPPTLGQVMTQGTSTNRTITSSNSITALSGSGNVIASGFIGDLTGTSSYATTSSYALDAVTASYVESLTGSVILNSVSTLNSRIEFGDIAQIGTSKIYGDVIKFGTSDGDLIAGNIYMLHTDGKWKETDADSEISSSGMLGVAVTTNIANGLLVKGICDVVMSNTTPTGSALYLSTQTSRATHSPASGSGDVIRAIGYTLDGGSGRIYFNPDATYIVAS